MIAIALLAVAAAAEFQTAHSDPCGHCKGVADGQITQVSVEYEEIANAIINVKCMSEQIEECLSSADIIIGMDERIYKVDCHSCRPKLVDDYACRYNNPIPENSTICPQLGIDTCPTTAARPVSDTHVCMAIERTGKVSPPGWPQLEIDVSYDCSKMRITKCKPTGSAGWIFASETKVITAASTQFSFNCRDNSEPIVTSEFVTSTCRNPTSVPVKVLGSKTVEVKVTFECTVAGELRITTCQPDRSTLKSPVKAGSKGTKFSVGGSKYYIVCKKFDMPCIGTKQEDCEKK